MSTEEKRAMIDPKNSEISVKYQCDIIGLAESSYYYKSVVDLEKRFDFYEIVERVAMERPEYGSRRIRDEICDSGQHCGRKKVQSAMRAIGIEANYPKPRTTIVNPEHTKYPYLLRGMDIVRPNQVWCTDITYIRVKNGWAYLVAIMDWATRKILSWRLSNSIDSSFCIEALEEALEGGTPEYFNTDQGSQFTCNDFINVLKGHPSIKISMDGKGRALDNVMIERFWRSIKYEYIYLTEHETIRETRIGIANYIDRYNTVRRHYGLNRRTPDEVYYAA